MSVRANVNCSQCGSMINRVTWNYRKNRPITEFFCNNDCKGAWQRAQREALGFTKEWLETEYCIKRRGANEIAKEIGRDAKRVWEWIRNYGIETRGRGEDPKVQFQRGKPSAFKGRSHTDAVKSLIRECRIADGRVPYLVDGKHWIHATGRKPATWKGGISPERPAFYATAEWKEAVKVVWRRDGAKCQICGKHHNDAESRGTFHIHHIVSFLVKELRADPDNLVLLCKKCHQWVHSRSNIERIFIKEIKNEKRA